ncbi:MAG: LytTR family transcriptional regulator DNA-binding domain-containing protein, partial [Sphingomonas sp.]|nr:LytTR family transcriptional regulator DNA-binding domain-containing protein [Sphingomonas sp.]
LKRALGPGRALASAAGLDPRVGDVTALVGGALLVTVALQLLMGTASLPGSGPGFELLLFQVSLIGAVIYALIRFLGSPRRARVAASETLQASAAGVRPRLMQRLPATFGDKLICMNMEDHYLRVHGVSGSALILMRMRDAVDELDGIDGAQVGRSWWVARDSVRRVLREGRSVRLELENQVTAPVARSRVPELRRRGWL